MFLSKEGEAYLEDQGIDLGRDTLDNKLLKATGGQGRIRAIVKDLEPGDVTINAQNLRKALTNIRLLNKLKIYNRDVRAENFKNGYLVDFGSAWTEPHCLLDALADWMARDSRLEDLVMFADMIAEEEIKTKLVVLPDFDFRDKLRSHQKRINGET